jgi:NADH-quinone oxidoreductase subunit C
LVTNEGTTPEAGGEAAASGAPATAVSFEGTVWPVVDRALSGISAEPERGVLDVIAHIPREEIIRGLQTLRRNEDTQFDYVRAITAVDLEEEGVDIVYLLYSTTKGHSVTVKCRLPADDLVVDSATTVWKGANWHERETREMFGVEFRGHPDPRNLLMPEDMEDTFPLRKDHPLAEIEVLQGEGLGYTEEDSA